MPLLPRQTPDSEPLPLSTGVMDRFNFAIQFEKYRDMILKRWWIFAVFLSIAMLVGGYQAYRKPDLYISMGKMMVAPRISNPVNPVYSEESSNFFGTQIQLMQGYQVQGEAQVKLVEFERGLPSPPNAQFNVIRIRDTAMFALSVTSTSPEYARRYLDAIMKEFIAYKKRLRTETAESAASTLIKEVDRLDKERKKAEEDLIAFQKVNNMAYLGEQGNVAVQYLIGLKKRLADVQTEIDLLNAETVEEHMMRAPDAASPSTTNAASRVENELPRVGGAPQLKLQNEYANIKGQLELLKADRETLAKSLKPKHPKIVQMDEEIERKEKLLKLSVRQTQEEINAYRQSLAKQKETLVKNIAEWEKSALEANQKGGEYSVLQANVKRTTELYDVLVKRLQEIDVGTGIEQEMIAINEPATEAALIGPSRTRILVMAMLAGLAIAVCVVVILEKLDDRVRNVEELQSMIPDTVLGQVPIATEGVENLKRPVINLSVHNSFSEAFRNIRSSLMFSPSASAARIIGITSAIPGDGKTTCAVNLAVAISQVERGKVLLIDTDMRRMSVHRYFGLENKCGVSDVLSGKLTFEEAVMSSGLPSLDILCAGTFTPNPGELILSDNFKLLLNAVSQTYHRVILDAGPVLALDDPLSMAPLMDGVIMVIKSNRTSMRFVQRALDLLKQRDAKILGLVLNGIDVNSAHYYYFYYYSNYYQTGTKAGKGASRSSPKKRTLAELALEAKQRGNATQQPPSDHEG
jgi:capsular exopolysaccharide synthesis family protein